MRSQNARGGARLTAIDAEPSRPVLELEARRADPSFEERLLRAQFKRERSSAYWFAASTWGIGGLVIGACLGAYMMYVATVATLPTAVNAVTQGMAVQELQRDIATRPNLMERSNPSGAAQP